MTDRKTCYSNGVGERHVRGQRGVGVGMFFQRAGPCSIKRGIRRGTGNAKIAALEIIWQHRAVLVGLFRGQASYVGSNLDPQT